MSDCTGSGLSGVRLAQDGESQRRHDRQPTPSQPLAPMRSGAEAESAQATEPSVNTTMPTAKKRLRPKRSPRVPLTGINTAKLRAYALITHSRSLKIRGASVQLTVERRSRW